MGELNLAMDCFYTLNAEDRIVDHGGPRWSAFAQENGGERLASTSLLGDSIYAHVAGHFTQRFLREFFNAARAADAPLVRHYRCDSPQVKRRMEMRARRENGDCLRVEHRLLDETAMAVEVSCRETAARRAEFSRCSICNRLRRLGCEDWREPDEAGVAGPLRVVHTVCSDCRTGISAHAPLRPAALI